MCGSIFVEENVKCYLSFFFFFFSFFFLLLCQFIKKANYDVPNPGVRYQYVIPSQLAGGQPGSPDDFVWKPDNWSGCSRSCASGKCPCCKVTFIYQYAK